jgi:kynurenine formamidase
MRAVDLTHPMATGMPRMDGIEEPLFEDVATVAKDGYAMSRYRFWNHTGTHVDAPSHQVLDGATLDEIPLERLVTAATVIDVRGRAAGAIPPHELEPSLDAVEPGDAVLFCSGNDANWGTAAYWHGWSYPDGEAARALLARGAVAVGFDGPSADPVESTTYDLHRIWLEAGALIIENLKSLDQLPRRCQLVIAPLRVAGANGAPARVFALVPDAARHAG